MPDFRLFLLIAAPIITIYALIHFFRNSIKIGKQIAQERAAKTPPAQRQDQPTASDVVVPSRVGNAVCVYQYYGVGLDLLGAVRAEQLLGQFLTFQPAQDHVLAIANGAAVGYVRDAQKTGMILDWLKRGDPIVAVVSHADDDIHDASFHIYFYRDQLQYHLKRDPDAKPVKLAGNRSGDAQDAASLCEAGEPCAIEHDPDKGRYAVLDSSGSLIGYLPSAAVKRLEVVGDDPESMDVFVAAVDLDDDGISVVSVYLF